jgi:SAM-dependent methyltransferase
MDLDQREDMGMIEQDFGADPKAVRDSDHYRFEYVPGFAEKWDQLVGWGRRSRIEGEFFCQLLKEKKARRVLDVATGTGFHSIRMLQAGFDVTSLDGSPAMLTRAQNNARLRGVTINPVQADWRHVAEKVSGPFDAIVCLGNSFTHLFSEDERRLVLKQWFDLLSPGGVLIADQRNYDAILDDKYINNHIFYCGQEVCVEPDYVDSGLARFRYAFPDNTVYYLNMFPLRNGYFRRLLYEAGFDPVTTYGDFEVDYDPDMAEFFVHVADKPGDPADQDA